MAELAHAHDPAGTAVAESGHGHGHPNLQHHFEDLGQQQEASHLGMWAFLGTEVMFFGGLIGAYLVYRFTSPDVWGVASRQLNAPLATFNTVILLTSSLTMALAVHAGQTGVRRNQVRFLLLTMALGTLFLGVKGYEYYEEYEKDLIPGRHFSVAELKLPTVEASEGVSLSAEEQAEVRVTTATASNLTETPPQFARARAQLFFVFYFCLTGLHAIHMIIGLVMLAYILSLARRGVFTPSYSNPLEVAGLYWHFIDIAWVFLYPLLYLVALHK